MGGTRVQILDASDPALGCKIRILGGQFVGEKAVHAPHIADRCDQDVQEDWRKWPPGRHAGVALENLFVVKVHTARINEYIRFRRGG